MGAGLGAHTPSRPRAVSAVIEKHMRRTPPTVGLASALCLPAAVAVIMIAIGQWDGPLFALALMLAPSLYLIERRA